MADRALCELTGLRLAAQSIAASPFTSASDVVRWMLAMQAQDYRGARWSVGLIEITEFAPLTTRARRGARHGIERYGRFLGKPVEGTV